MSAYLNVVGVGELVDRHPVTVRRALESGDMHGFQRKPRSPWRIDPACARAWVEGRVCEHMQNVTPIRRSA
ncbi:hypothetical protein ACFWGP_05635 [Agromyces sp. NPDC127015]|uniref:hypothetical protein n=1 Tax=Agromyces sp. NPDC127015 TaxID=3347108 RepID=UPI00366065A5